MKVGLIMKALTQAQYNQRVTNDRCEMAFRTAMDELAKFYHFGICTLTPKALRSCNARVYETENWYILQSYNTFVCVICKFGFEIYDLLRVNYGYTATSAQHIAKFIHDYTPYPWNSPRFTVR